MQLAIVICLLQARSAARSTVFYRSISFAFAGSDDRDTGVISRVCLYPAGRQSGGRFPRRVHGFWYRGDSRHVYPKPFASLSSGGNFLDRPSSYHAAAVSTPSAETKQPHFFSGVSIHGLK